MSALMVVFYLLAAALVVGLPIVLIVVILKAGKKARTQNPQDVWKWNLRFLTTMVKPTDAHGPDTHDDG